MGNSIIDLIIRIKNGYLARRETVESPVSKYRLAVLDKLVELKFVKKYQIDKRDINIELLYKDNMPVLTDVKIFSKPGQRFYVSYKDLKPVLGGLGCSLLSTPKGILTNREARKEKTGGELLFSIW